MKIAYNPIGGAVLTVSPPENDITFDLPGLAIWAKGVRFGKYETFLKHTSNSGGGRDGLVPAPNYTATAVRFLREDGTWVTPTNTDTKNTTGSTNSTSKLYLIGATEQSANPQTYSNSNVYATNGVLTANGIITAGLKCPYTGDGIYSMIAPHQNALTYGRYSLVDFENETGIAVTDNANGVLWVGTHTPGASNTGNIGYGHMLGFVGGNGALYHKIVTNGNTTKAWKQIAYTSSNITGNAASADKLKTKRKLWGLDFDGTADVSGSLTGVTSINMDGDIVINDGTNNDRYIKFQYNNTDTYAWRLGYTGSQHGENNDFVIQTTGADGSNTTFNNVLQLKPNKNAIFSASVTATTFIGNLDGKYVNALTGYTKATSASNIAAVDTLNTALGKLEYKAHYAYNWVTSVTATDTNEYIDKWGEIVDFLDSVAEGTDITNEFVTVKTTLDITGLKTFKTTSDKDNLIGVALKLGNDGWYTNIQTAVDFYNGRSYTVPNARMSVLMNGDGKAGGTMIFSTQTKHESTNPNPNDLVERMRIDDNGLVKISGALTVTGNINGAKFVTSGGTASQFVKGDGTLDSNTYATTTSLSNYVTLTGEQTITGRKTFATSGGHSIKLQSFNSSVTDNYQDWVSISMSCKIKNTDSDEYVSHTGYFVYRGNSDYYVTNSNWESAYKILHSGNYSNYLPFLNSTSTHATNASKIYAPTSGGTAGLILKSNGNAAPTWVNSTTLTAGSITHTSIGTNDTNKYYLLGSSSQNSSVTVNSHSNVYIQNGELRANNVWGIHSRTSNLQLDTTWNHSKIAFGPTASSTSNYNVEVLDGEGSYVVQLSNGTGIWTGYFSIRHTSNPGATTTIADEIVLQGGDSNTYERPYLRTLNMGNNVISLQIAYSTALNDSSDWVFSFKRLI